MLNSSNIKKVHECQICGKAFSRRTYLQLHEKIHGEKCYKCNVCDKTFRQPAGLWIHKKHQSCLKPKSLSNSNTSSACKQVHETTEDSRKPHKCDVCNRAFSQKHLLVYHKRTHTGETPYPCTTCGKMFRGAVTLKYHQRTHTGQKPYKCIFCVKAFTQLGPLKQHTKKEHQSEKVYECEVCREKFEKFRELSSHKNIHSEIIRQVKSSCKTEFRTEDIECEAPPKELTTDDCKSLDTFMDINNKMHLETSIKSSLVSAQDEEGKGRTSGNEEHFKSGIKDECNVSFDRQRKNGFQCSNKSIDTVAASTEQEDKFITVSKERSASVIDETLKTIADTDVSLEEDQTLAKVKQEHEYANVDVDGKKYKCGVCNQEFTQAHVLKYHKRIHTGENPHSCTVCDKTFRTPGALTVHQRTHSGQKPYKCIFCSKGFTQRGPLQQHCKRIHRSDQIYECDICKERFEKYKDMSCHKQTHFDVPNTMVKREYDDVIFAIKCEDEAKPSQEMENAIPEVLVNYPRHSSDVNVGSCDSYKKNNIRVKVEPSCNVRHDDKHSKNSCNSTSQEAENMDISFCLSAIPRIKQEKEDCDCSADSGVFPDTSPLDVNVESDEREALQEVSMQPVNMECEEIDNYMSTMWNSPSQTTGDVEFSLQKSQTFSSNVDVDRCSKTSFIEKRASDDDEVSNCSRVTTPENDHIFSICHRHLPQNSFFDKKLEARSCYEFLTVDHSTYSVPPPGVKHQKWEEGGHLSTSGSRHNSGYYTKMDVLPVHSDTFCQDAKVLNSSMKFDNNVCESQTSNVQPGLFENQVNFAKTNTLACLEKSVTRGSTGDDNKVYHVLSDGKLKQRCFCLRNKTGITPQDRQEEPKYELGKTVTGSGTHTICFECDVLPASSHLV